jgi:hypothetical protein
VPEHAAVEVDASAFPSATINEIDNMLGRINVSAARLTESPLSGAVRVASIRSRPLLNQSYDETPRPASWGERRFRCGFGLVASASTQVVCARTEPRRCDLVSGGASLGPVMADGTITTPVNTPTSAASPSPANRTAPSYDGTMPHLVISVYLLSTAPQ